MSGDNVDDLSDLISQRAKEWQKTVKALRSIDRERASKINPIISDNVSGTCLAVSIAIRALGNEETSETIDANAFALLQNVLAAALEFEALQDEEAKPEAKEAPVTRVK